MGCVSSILIRKEIEQENHCKSGDYINHVVSLTSTTYGVLRLDKENQQLDQPTETKQRIKECVIKVKKSPPHCLVERKKSPSREEPSEMINAWELMEGLEEQVAITVQSKKSPKARLFIDARSPLKFLNQLGSPRKSRKSGGNSPKTVLKDCTNMKENSKKPSPRLWASIKGSPNATSIDSVKVDSGVVSSRRRSLGPLLDDPEFVASLGKDVSEKEEHVKKIASVSMTPRSRLAKNISHSNDILELYDEKCPPGGENAVVIYTTTLRGIRKTFEDCNVARSVIESQNVQMFERDISMHSGFKEELRGLMGTKEVKMPLVFVKGRLIGGANEMIKLDEEGNLGTLFDGIPRAAAGCDYCAGIRFVMCMKCNGSCKVLGEDGKKSVKCCECNENGLIQCSFCC